MNTVVIGAGSLGTLVGGILAHEHDVTLVAREDHVRAVRESGLRLEGVIDAAPSRVFPAATTDG
ncbi:ketopantoate reductase family protein, partial [Natrinema soli]